MKEKKVEKLTINFSGEHVTIVSNEFVHRLSELEQKDVTLKITPVGV